jgi:exonuclease III
VIDLYFREGTLYYANSILEYSGSSCWAFVSEIFTMRLERHPDPSTISPVRLVILRHGRCSHESIRWNTLKTGEAILNELKADIICFQGVCAKMHPMLRGSCELEMKSSRSALEKHIAVPPSYDSYFSFPVAKGGYSGVAVYTSANATAGKAEEGITGSLQPKPPFSSEEKIGGYPSVVELVERLVPDEQGNTPSDLGVLDTEGRGLVVDFGLFVLINVYCPNETSDARLPFKACSNMSNA